VEYRPGKGRESSRVIREKTGVMQTFGEIWSLLKGDLTAFGRF
jgi:hypothetical protein